MVSHQTSVSIVEVPGSASKSSSKSSGQQSALSRSDLDVEIVEVMGQNYQLKNGQYQTAQEPQTSSGHLDTSDERVIQFNGLSLERPEEDDTVATKAIETFMAVCSVICVVLTFPFCLFFSVKIVNEFERLVLFRFGKINQSKGPGFHVLLPFIDFGVKVDLRIYSFTIKVNQLILSDSVSVSLDAIIWARVTSVVAAVTMTDDYLESVKLFSAAIFRKVLSTYDLASIVNDADRSISIEILRRINLVTSKIGVKIQRVDIRNISLPTGLQRVMASEGLALRHAKAMNLFAGGERDAAKPLTQAGLNMSRTALSMRYMQVLGSIQTKTEDSTLFFPVPMDFGILMKKKKGKQPARVKKVEQPTKPLLPRTPASLDLSIINDHML